MGGTEDGGITFLENTDIHLPNYTVTLQYRVILFTRHLRPFCCVADFVPVASVQRSGLLLGGNFRPFCCVAAFVPVVSM
jgi:hypothetical protein